MTPRPFIGMALLLLLAGISAEPAQARPRCDEGTARRATITQVVRDYERWRGRCVAIRGVSDGTMLVTGVEAYRRARRLNGAEAAEKDPGDSQRIGLHGPRLQRRVPPGRLREVTAYGVVSSCYDDYAEAEVAAQDASFTLLGYCSRAEGPLIHLRDLEVGRPVRGRVETGSRGISALI
ncbi:MAG TPA: hypothetical protein VEZ20_05640 [Allosphingosinicella sp.]|nr:hypothetical protein [Allosphingosinicella sp.]